MLLQDYKQKLQEEATKNLVGNYLRGAAENAARSPFRRRSLRD